MIELELFSCPISSCFILFSTSAMPCHLTRDVAAPADVPRMRHIPSLGEATPSWTKGETTRQSGGSLELRGRADHLRAGSK